MPIKSKISKESLDRADETNAHFIPASIDGNGSIKIDEYFNSYMVNDESGLKINSLRGYPIKGIEVSLPDNLQGVIIRENEKLQIEGHRELKLGGKFNKFTYWNYDKNPTQNDAFQKSLHWMKVSEALHSEVDSLDDAPK